MVLAVIREIVHRHETFRTTYEGHDRESLSQVVHEGDVVPVVLAEEAASEEIINKTWQCDFELAEEFPARFFVVMHEQLPLKVACVMHHIAIDHWGLMLLEREFHAGLKLLIQGLQPARHAPQRSMIDVAESEQREISRERSSRALRYWESMLEQYPGVLYPAAAHDTSRGHVMTLRSQGARRAVALIAERHNVSQPAVVAAAYGIALRSLTGRQRLALVAACTTRRGAENRQVVGCMYQTSALPLNVPDGSQFSDIVKNAYHGMLKSIRHGSYDSFDWRDILERHGLSKPFYFHGWAGYNFLLPPTRYLSRDSADVEPEEPESLINCDRWQYDESRTDFFLAMSLFVSPGDYVLRLSLAAREDVLTAEDMRAFLTTIEDALDDAARCR
jgi:hypothetical protein